MAEQTSSVNKLSWYQRGLDWRGRPDMPMSEIWLLENSAVPTIRSGGKDYSFT